MAAPFATLNGEQIMSGTIAIPLVGMWTADVAIDNDTIETGAVTLVIGNLTMQGAVIRSAPFAGQTKARIVGGGGGWRNVLPAKGYSNQSGVMLSMVLRDAASEAGEKVNVPNDTSIGPFYARPNDKASFSLRTLCPSWYVDASGTTQIAAWPVVAVGTPFTVIDQRPDEGIIEIATEDYTAWMPGASFTSATLAGTFQCYGVVYEFSKDGKFRMRVMTDSSADRLLGPLNSIVDQRVSPTRFYGRYRYTISNPSTSTVDASPMDQTIGLPGLTGVPLDSDSISTYVPPNGGECHIMFADGRPTMPRVVWTAGTATVVNVLGGSVPVARQGDQVTCFLPPTLPINGLINGSETLVGTVVIPNPISGSISGPCSATVNVQ
jgi:hypothetical protein